MGKMLVKLVFGVLILVLALLLILKVGNNGNLGGPDFLGSVKVFAETQVTTDNNTKDIFISEINYAGSVEANNCKVGNTTFNCNSDKWVELYNPTNSTIDLSSYSFLVGGNQKELKLSGSISAGDHVVIKNKNQTISSVLGGNYQLELGFLQNISSKENQAINLKLLKDGKVQDDKSQSVIQFQQYQTATQRHSLEFEAVNSLPKLSSSIYSQNGILANYGTPNLNILPNSKPIDTLKELKAIATIITTDPIQTSMEQTHLLSHQSPLSNLSLINNPQIINQLSQSAQIVAAEELQFNRTQVTQKLPEQTSINIESAIIQSQTQKLAKISHEIYSQPYSSPFQSINQSVNTLNSEKFIDTQMQLYQKASSNKNTALRYPIQDLQAPSSAGIKERIIDSVIKSMLTLVFGAWLYFVVNTSGNLGGLNTYLHP